MISPLLALFLVAGSASTPAKPDHAEIRSILVALMSHYQKEFAKSPSVCVDPVVPQGDFDALKDPATGLPFADHETNEALLAAVPQSAVRMPRSILPRRFRLNSHEDCVDNLSLYAPAISGDYAFLTVRWMEIENGDGGGTIDLFALRREGSRWRVRSKHTLVYMN